MWKLRALPFTIIIILLAGFICFAEQSPAAAPPYNGFFDGSIVHVINIEISEEDWQDLKDNAVEKRKYEVSAIIDGERFEEVVLSAKGNASLSRVAAMGSDRYNFKLNFNKHDKDRTYYGLDKMKLANMYNDPSYMRDYLSYRIISEAGGYAPLASNVWVTINGEDFGLYLAVEEIDKSWLSRTQNNKGKLYKPDPAWVDSSNKVPGLTLKDAKALEYFLTKRAFFGNDDAGADLLYSDENPESYSAIFDNAVVKANEDDQIRLVQSLKGLKEQSNLSSVLNTSEVIRYFAGHNFTMNYDSYTGITAHNYYLYEEKGILSMAAWDYNDGFGLLISALHPELTMTDIVNWGIDTPLCDVELLQRPMWAWIVENDDYLQEYHAAMGELLGKYFQSGRFIREIDEVYHLIRPYVYKDPTRFYSTDRFEREVESMKAFCIKRAESIQRQLDGALSADTMAQEAEAKVDASDVVISH